MTNAELKKMVVEELKKEGLDVAEEAAVSLVKALFRVIPKVVLATENKMDDLLIPVLAVVEPKIMELLDKIDGKDDPGR